MQKYSNQPNFKEFTNSKQEVIYYTGNPNLQILDKLSKGCGDLWHSSFEQGYKNAFSDIIYFAAVFFWYVKDFDALNDCVSWRVNPNAFAIRKEVWEQLQGFDQDFKNLNLAALDFGFNLLKNHGGIPLYYKGLYEETLTESLSFSSYEVQLFFRKNFKIDHAIYRNFRKGFWKVNEWCNLIIVAQKYQTRNAHQSLLPRELKDINGTPTVSYIIPTMLRQEFTLSLLNDLKHQTYLPSQVIVVDATPVEQRKEHLYQPKDYPFELLVLWQTTKGSCRARNEAIELCTSDYIIFGDDDIRFFPDFIENHIKLLQAYNAVACNGLDIRADHQQQNLEDLQNKINQLGAKRWKVGASNNFSNANSCVRREFVQQLVGNDINYDGGYGEDGDFGLSLTKIGATVLHNPFSVNLHLKPTQGGYRFWGSEAKVLGKKRKSQPWELDTPIKRVRPVPSPTVMYQLYKHFGEEERTEYFYKYFLKQLFKKGMLQMPLQILKLPYKILQFRKSEFYAKKLIAIGKRTK